MVKETMTVHMALSEMKTMEKRIEKAIKGIVPIGVKENSSRSVNAISVDAFEKDVRTMNQSVQDLIKRYNAMKTALYRYNVSKQIRVAGREMSVAEALWLMKHGMEQKRSLLAHYESAYKKAQAETEKYNNELLNAAAEKCADAACGGKDNSRSEDYLKMVEQYKESHRKVYVDPLNLKALIHSLSEEIMAFDAEVDARIQTANAMTEIVVEY